MRSEILHIALALLAGVALGTFFFGGLWFTVKKAVTAKRPAIWFLASFFFRITVTLAGFYYIALGSWLWLLICVGGFILARFIITQLLQPIGVKQTDNKDMDHET